MTALLSALFVSAPELLVIVFALITQLGDAWFLVVGLSMLYWIGPRYIENARPVAAIGIGFALLGLSVVLALKSYIALPRPPLSPVDPLMLPSVIGPFVAGEVDASGFGFPSGHAVGSTVVYGGLGLLLTVGRRRVRYLVAAGCILLISLSRVVLQVHYPRDVLVGIGVGLVLLAIGLTVAKDTDRLRPERLFVLAAVASVVGLGVALWMDHPREILQGALAVGSTVGGVVIWHQWGDRLLAAPAVSLPLSVVGLAVAGGLWVGAYSGLLPIAVAIAASAAGIGIIFALPLVAERMQEKTQSVTAS